MEMKAAVLWNIHEELRIETVSLPAPKPLDVLVRIVGSGVCGSDLHVIDGELPYFACPIVTGHEAAGIVEEVGSAVTTVSVGDQVVLGWIPGCGACYACWNGAPAKCGNVTFGGVLYDGHTRLSKGERQIFSMVHIGGFAEYALVGERTCIKIREDAPLDRVCLIGCGVSTGYGSVFHSAKVIPGSTALVIGCGGVGLNVIQFLALAAATTIIAVDLNDSKLHQARLFGATHTVNGADHDTVAAVMEVTRGQGVDYAFEVISTPRTIRQAYDATRRGGVVSVVGVAPPDAELTIPANVRKTLQGAGPGGTQWM